MSKVAIIQSNYIPWKGYFDIIHDCDLFVFYDDVQYTHGDWRNRNKIKTNTGSSWLTIPVGSNLNRLICEVNISNHSWQIKHWKTLLASYSKSPYFNLYRSFLEHVYLERKWSHLSELNHFLIKHISIDFLGISNTKFEDSRTYEIQGKKESKLLETIKRTGSNIYISGPAAKDYINDENFKNEGIELIYKNYVGYPVYDQSYPPFDHYVTVLDLLFNVGNDAPYYIWGWREKQIVGEW